MSQSPIKSLLGILNSYHFQSCADCGQSSPDHASVNLGIFICQRCAEVHRLLGKEISVVKSIRYDEWDYDLLKNFNEIGNEKSNERYEKSIPLYYFKPSPNAPFVLREQWIISKYERKEFIEEGIYQEPDRMKCGVLLKRGKKGVYREKYFCLTEEDGGTLKYYDNNTCEIPKGIIHVDDLEIYVAPAKMDRKYGMQFAHYQNGNSFNLYVCGRTSKDTIDWYMALRSIQFVRLRIAYPGFDDCRLLPRLSNEFTVEGWLHKSGPKPSDAFRLRWFSLGENKCSFLRYFASPLDNNAKGEISLGYMERGYKIMEGLPLYMKDPGNSFTLYTPKRNYHFCAKTEEIMHLWVEKLKFAIARPSGL